MEKERYSGFEAPDFLLDEDFVAWLKGDDPVAEEAWQQWLAENPAGRVEVEKARLLWGAMSFPNRTVDEKAVDEAWHRLRKKAIRDTSGATGAGGASARVLPVWLWLAAACVVLVVGVWVGKDYLSKRQSSRVSQTRAANGQQVTITLTDGTTVRLNAGSTLTYPAAFAADKREVRLNGEGYFEVASKATAPFLIHTDDVDVQVIGTKLTVKAYPESESVKVAVVEGKVAVHAVVQEAPASEEEVILAKDEMATLEKSNGALSVSGYDKNDIMGWQNGILYFEKASFPQIVNQLERWYGVEIRVEDEIGMDADWRFSGKFKNKPIGYILDVCRYPNLFAYRVSDRKVHITRK